MIDTTAALEIALSAAAEAGSRRCLSDAGSMRGTSWPWQRRADRAERALSVRVADTDGPGEIGSRLFITEGTVKNHVSSLLGKLQLRDRTQAVLFARDEGLI